MGFLSICPSVGNCIYRDMTPAHVGDKPDHPEPYRPQTTSVTHTVSATRKRQISHIGWLQNVHLQKQIGETGWRQGRRRWPGFYCCFWSPWPLCTAQFLQSRCSLCWHWCQIWWVNHPSLSSEDDILSVVISRPWSRDPSALELILSRSRSWDWRSRIRCWSRDWRSRSRSWSRDLKAKVSVLVSRPKGPGLGLGLKTWRPRSQSWSRDLKTSWQQHWIF